jgi:inosine-uridine nucleoside N-ribohydrolase
MKIILDFDNTMGLPKHEIDDGLTLLYLLGRADIEILGITTTFGNGSLEEVMTATRELMAFTGKQIPVYEGEATRGQGETAAARFLATTVAANPDNVTILAIGPLGNLGTASKIDPDFFAHCREIVCMGGMVEPMRLGWRDIGELNLSANPEASWTVLHNTECPVTVMNAHVCLDATFGYVDMLRVMYMPKHVRQAILKWLFIFGTYYGVFKFYLWDLLPALYVSHPELFTIETYSCESSLQDMESGRLVVERNEQGNFIMPGHIIDVGKFNKILFDGWREGLKAIGK